MKSIQKASVLSLCHLFMLIGCAPARVYTDSDCFNKARIEGLKVSSTWLADKEEVQDRVYLECVKGKKSRK